MPEEFNLSANMSKTDATAPEFIRTFPVREFRGVQYLDVLKRKLEADNKRDFAWCVLPVRGKKQHNRNTEPIPWTSLYAYRGTDERCYHMCPLEFWQFWDPVRLQAPYFYDRGANRGEHLTQWTEEGKKMYELFKEDNTVELRPGIDYEPVKIPPTSRWEHIFLPSIEGEHAERMQTFRAQWALRRTPRPIVLAPTQTPLPGPHDGKEKRARINSVYLRPWVLYDKWTSAEVPLISQLHMIPKMAEVPRWIQGKRNKRKCSEATTKYGIKYENVGFRAAWKHYVRGNVVSECAVKLIRNYLTTCSTHKHGDDEEEEEPGDNVRKNINWAHEPLSVQKVQNIIENMRKQTKVTKDDEDMSISNTLVKGMQLVASRWPVSTTKDSSAAIDVSCGAAKLEDATTEDVSPQGVSGSVVQPRAKMLPKIKVTWEQWKMDLFAGKKPPTAEQWRVLEEISKRASVEDEELNQKSRKTSVIEPLRLLVQGLPGAGKSQVIKWIRSLFEDVLGYTHATEFVCVASMNTMATLIGGMTLHTWGEIPFNEEASVDKAGMKRKKPDVSTMFVKCQNLRWILIDEGSSAGCENLGIMDTGMH